MDNPPPTQSSPSQSRIQNTTPDSPAARWRHVTCVGKSAVPAKNEPGSNQCEDGPVHQEIYDKAGQPSRLAVAEFLASGPTCDLSGSCSRRGSCGVDG